MSWTGGGPTSAQWYGNLRTQPITIISNYEYLNVTYLSTTLTTASTINAINVNSIDMNTITFSTNQIHLSSNTILTGANASLYINGILVTDASNASNTSQWADFPAINTINANNKNLTNLNTLFGNIINASNIYNNRTFWGSNINVSTINVRGLLTGSNITCSNITVRNTVSAANGNFTNTSANDAAFVNTTSVFTNTTLLASVNGTITTLSNTTLTSRTANISNFFGKLIRGENLFVSSITTLNNISGASLDVGSITTDTDIYGSNLFMSTIVTEGLVAGAIRIGRTLLPVLPWDQVTLYGTNDVISYSNFAGNFIYIATSPSRAQPPTSNIINWESGSNYNEGNYSFVEGVGSYRCIQNIFGSTISPNGDLVNWTAYSGDRTPTMWSVGASPEETFIGSITGDGFSFITVGTGNFNTLNATNIVSSNSIHSNIYSYNIYNSNVIDTDSLVTNTTNTFGETATGVLNVINNTTLNTLTTSGAVNINNTANTNNAFYVNGGMYLNSDIDANTEANIVIGLPPKYLHDINNIRNITVEKITVIGGSTNNTVLGIPVAPFRNNSIVEIGVTEFSPAQVSIYGFNPLGDTTALDVYGEMNVNVGSFNSYYVANFYPVNIEANAINVYGISFLNGGVVITGLLEATGAITVTGLATLTGDLNVTGLTTLTGETNILGGLTVEAGIGVVGAMFFGEGDFVIGDSGGSAFLNNYNVYIYYNGLNIKNITVNGTGDFRQSVSILGNLTAPTFITSNITASNMSLNSLVIQNSNATKRLTFGYSNIEEVGGFFIESDDTILMQASNVLFRGTASAGILSDLTATIAGVETNISADTIINIVSQGQLFAQASGNINFNSFSNINFTATETLEIGGDASTSIGSVNGNVAITTFGSNQIQIGNFAGGPIIMFSSNTGISIGDGSINFEATSNINLTSVGNTLIIGNIVGVGAEDTLILAGVSNLTIQAGQVDFVESSNVNFNNTTLSNIGTLYASNAIIQTIQSSQLNVSNIVASNIRTPALSTISISTGTIFLSSINALNNINIGKSLVPFTGSNLDLGGLGSNFRQLFVSTIRCISSIVASTIITDRLFTNTDSGIRTQNLYPNSAGAQIGFGPALGSGGFYNIGTFRSTITTHLLPASDGAATANNIKVNGHLSTISLGVSTINFKPYPFISTLNNPVATASVSVASAPILSRIQSNTLRFPRPGTYRIDQQYSITKSAGGTNQHTHGSLVYASNGATTATISNATNWPRMAMSAVPFQDKTGFSTFTSVSATILANSANLTRDVFYYDSGTGTYTADFYLAPPTITYIPSPGILPDT